MISVPSDFVNSIYYKTLGISLGGGNNQLFSFSHEAANASILSEHGLGQRLLNLVICLVRKELKQSMVCDPHRISKAAKVSGCNMKSSTSTFLDAKSEIMFYFRGSCVEIVKYYTYLGVTFKHNLLFDKHIQNG